MDETTLKLVLIGTAVAAFIVISHAADDRRLQPVASRRILRV
jgi:hypothetical protein